MANLKMDTEACCYCCYKIEKINNQIQNDFSDLQKEITQLDNSWESSVAVMTIGKFYDVKSKYLDACYHFIDNYVNFLLSQVGEGYVQTEETNKSLSDQFK
ncbi:hypothetical protein SD457_11545 [Coprobacillaceae bacterium CR2/5/TPMF4]|nr:hypothetical protein SD457_11545 [Coprobacillaceae bacterium CR2/5/TPMF4]